MGTLIYFIMFLQRICTFVRILLLAAPLASARTGFTGNAVLDFGNSPSSVYVEDSETNVIRAGSEARNNLYVAPDVGLPAQFPPNRFSGFDIERVFFDYADLSRDEGFIDALDFNLDVTNANMQTGGEASFDVAIGVPSGQPGEGDSQLECTIGAEGDEFLSLSRCFGLYEYNADSGIAMLQRFAAPLRDDEDNYWTVRNENSYPRQQYPDLEWTIERVSALRERFGAVFERSNEEAWSLRAQAFGGSFADDGIGEDFVPSDAEYAQIDFACAALDACGVCFGDDSSCADCEGVPNGPPRTTTATCATATAIR